MRHHLLVAVAVVAAAGSAAGEDLAARARRLHAEAIVVDAHLDTPDQLARRWADVATRGATDHFDLPRARQGGLSAPFFSIYVSAQYAARGGAARRALELIDLTRRVVDGHPRDMVLATTVAEVRAAKRAGKLAVLMGIEGGHAIEDSLAVLRELYRAGARYLTLTHTNTNGWADSSGSFSDPDDPGQHRRHGGLSPFGRAVVKEMNRLGMIVDVSHVSDETVDDVLASSRAPVMASHSSCRALVDMPRNLTDDQIRRIAARGGVVMVNFGSSFLDQRTYDAFVAASRRLAPTLARLKASHRDDPGLYHKAAGELFAKENLPRATVAQAADHIDRVIAIGGIDAVGLGTDFDGVRNPPTGLEDYSRLTALTEELLRRGRTDGEIKKILGENFLAFMARVEGVKRSLVGEPPGLARI